MNFWSTLSHGIATALTWMPVCCVNGCTIWSKWAVVSPITQTVRGPVGAGAPDVAAAGVPPVAAGVPPPVDEHAASANAATMPTGTRARRVKEFAIEDPFQWAQPCAVPSVSLAGPCLAWRQGPPRASRGGIAADHAGRHPTRQAYFTA